MFKIGTNLRQLLLIAGLGAASVSHAFAAEGNSQPVVLELFTSQGCADAPPADRLVEELAAANRNITVLTCHADYFDRGGWEDTLSYNLCENRQRGYADTLNISGSQTPQFIINGVYDTIGENDDAVLSVLDTAQHQDEMFNFGLRLEPGALTITVPDAALARRADIWLFGFDREHVVDIEAGQNAGSTIKYVNVVRHIVKILKWDGPSKSYTMDLNLVPADGYTIIAQYERQGKIIGASTVVKTSSINPDPQ